MRPLEAAEKTVLLIDDDELILTVLRHALVGAGYRVRTCSTVESFEIESARHPLDVAVLDVHIPDLGFGGAVERLRTLHPSVAILAMSGSDEPARASMASEFIRKPFSYTDFLDALNRLASLTHSGAAS